MVGSISFAGVAALTLVAPFELTSPLVRLPRQSVSNLEAVVLCACVCAAAAFVVSRRLPAWRTPLTPPWAALILAMCVASAASPVSLTNAFHMTGRMAAALCVFFVAFNGVTTPARLRRALTLAVAVGVLVSVLAILEYRGVRPVLSALTLFRPSVSTVGAQVRAGGPLQYPTIASMYLEVVFAVGLGVLLAEFDAARRTRVAILCAALVVIAEAIALTFTRAGLMTMAMSLLLVGAIRRMRYGTDTGTALLGGLAVVIVLLVAASRPAALLWLRMTSEGQESWYRATVVAPPEVELAAGRLATIAIAVTNSGRLPWDSNATPPMLLSYHWLAPDASGFVAFEGERTPFAGVVAPGESATVAVRVRAPREPGRYRLEWDLVQEGRLWFSTEPGAVRVMSRALVDGNMESDDVVATMALPRPTVRPGRLALWRAAASMVAAYPLAGVGPDNFRLAYGKYAGLPGADERTHSNNMYLEMLAGGGLLVATAFTWLAWRAAGVSLGLIVLARGAADAIAALGSGLAAAVLAIAVHATVDSFLSFAPTYVLFALTLGCAAACARGLEIWPDAHRL